MAAAGSPHKGQPGNGTHVSAIVVEGRQLYATGIDSSLWSRAVDGAGADWARIGEAQDVVALAAYQERIFALDSSSRIWQLNL